MQYKSLDCSFTLSGLSLNPKVFSERFEALIKFYLSLKVIILGLSVFIAVKIGVLFDYGFRLIILRLSSFW